MFKKIRNHSLSYLLGDSSFHSTSFANFIHDDTRPYVTDCKRRSASKTPPDRHTDGNKEWIP